MGRQLVGRGVGGEGHPRFARLDGGAAHPVLPAPFHPEAAVRVGDQLPARHRAQKRAGLPRLHAQERQRLRVPIRGPGGARNYWVFNWAEPRFFYSRRIGRAPQGSVPSADFSDMPVGAHILGALKMTGKAAGSWNVGALSAVTGRETARLDTAGTLFKKEVEPLTYYGVFRAQKEFPDGRQGLRVMSTVAPRGFQDPTLRGDV